MKTLRIALSWIIFCALTSGAIAQAGAPTTVPGIEIEGLPIALGDKLSQVRQVFGVTDKPRPVQSLATFINSQLDVPEHGIILFFNQKEEITVINLGYSFKGSVGGVRVRQRLPDLQKLRGEPTRILGGGKSFMMSYLYEGPSVAIEYSMGPSRRIDRIFIRRVRNTK